MNFTKLLFLIFISITSSQIFAQAILIKVKKGTAMLGAQMITDASKSTELKSTDFVEVKSGALLIARQDVTVVELSTAKKYTYKDIASLIKSKKEKNSGGFVDVAFGDPIQKNGNNLEKGATSRGTSGFDHYYPQDNSKVSEPKIVFIVGNHQTKMESNIVLKNISSGKVYFDGIPTDNKFELANLPPGNYEWGYVISNKHHKAENLEFLNVFSVVAEKEAAEINKQIENYRKDLKQFSPELQKILLEEYCDTNHFYLKR
jgi:hypothetical protein